MTEENIYTMTVIVCRHKVKVELFSLIEKSFVYGRNNDLLVALGNMTSTLQLGFNCC